MNDSTPSTMNPREEFLFNTGMFLYLIVIFLTYIIHFWTVTVVYNFHGLGAAILSFFLPVISQIYCILHQTTHHETLLTAYFIGLFLYLFLFLLMMLCLVVSTSRGRCEINNSGAHLK